MRIVSDFALLESSQGRTIVYDYCDISEAIYLDECIVLVVLEMKQSSVNYFVGEWQVPPNLKVGGVSFTGKERAVPIQRCRWGLWNNEGNRHFERNPRVVLQGLLDKI